MKTYRHLTILACTLILGTSLYAEPRSTAKVDRTETAEGQGTSEKDVQTTRDIRKQLLDSKLSTAAKNVQVITRNGDVIMRGSVKTPEEKEEVLAKAKQIAGRDRVTDRVEIAK